MAGFTELCQGRTRRPVVRGTAPRACTLLLVLLGALADSAWRDLEAAAVSGRGCLC